MRFCIFIFMLVSVSGFAKDSRDTLLPKNSLRLDIGGNALFIGIGYERNLKKKNPEKHSKAFSSVDGTLSYAGYTFITTGVGLNRNWKVSKNNRLFLNLGLYGIAFICLNPTPKAIRQYYDSIHFSGGEYINPIEPWLLLNLGVKYTFHHFFIKASFTPVLFYDRAYADKFIAYPYGGISFGTSF